MIHDADLEVRGPMSMNDAAAGFVDKPSPATLELGNGTPLLPLISQQ
jgi:hypothetical protein